MTDENAYHLADLDLDTKLTSNKVSMNECYKVMEDIDSRKKLIFGENVSS